MFTPPCSSFGIVFHTFKASFQLEDLTPIISLLIIRQNGKGSSSRYKSRAQSTTRESKGFDFRRRRAEYLVRLQDTVTRLEEENQRLRQSCKTKQEHLEFALKAVRLYQPQMSTSFASEDDSNKEHTQGHAVSNLHCLERQGVYRSNPYYTASFD